MVKTRYAKLHPIAILGAPYCNLPLPPRVIGGGPPTLLFAKGKKEAKRSGAELVGFSKPYKLARNLTFCEGKKEAKRSVACRVLKTLQARSQP
jgi:hypothetical protein